MVRAFNYFINEGVRSFIKNGLMSVASVITVSLCLVLFGVYVLFSANINYMAEQVEANYEIRIFIDENAVQPQISRIEAELNAIDNINGVAFVSKEESLEEWKQKFGDGAEIFDGLELDNPLRDSFNITLNSLALADETIGEILRINDVANIKNNKPAMDKLMEITTGVQKVSFWLMIFFALISVFIISNAIRITVFARRREINIMKFVGGTDWFISCPFVIEGIIIGLIGSLVALLVASQAYGYVIANVGLVIENSIKIYSLRELFGILLGALAGMGVMLGALGSGISLRRHLYV